MLSDFLPSYADHRLLALVLYPLKIPAIPDQEANHVDSDFAKEIESIARQIAQKYGPERIILFGSAALDDAGPESDPVS